LPGWKHDLYLDFLPSVQVVEAGSHIPVVIEEPFDASFPDPTTDDACPSDSSSDDTSGDEPCMHGDTPANVHPRDMVEAFKAAVCILLPRSLYVCQHPDDVSMHGS
jgi:hypothetical protein